MENVRNGSEYNIPIRLNIVLLISNIILVGIFIFIFIFIIGWVGDGNIEYYFTYDFFMIIFLGLFFILLPVIYAGINFRNLSKKNIVFVIINGLVFITQEVILDIYFSNKIGWNDGLTIDYIFLILWTIGSIGLAISLLFFFKWKFPLETVNKEKIKELQIYE